MSEVMRFIGVLVTLFGLLFIFLFLWDWRNFGLRESVIAMVMATVSVIMMVIIGVLWLWGFI